MAPQALIPDRAPRISLRMRLTLWVIAIFLFFEAAAGAAFWSWQHATIRNFYEERLLERGRSVASEVRSRLPGLSRIELLRIAQREMGFLQFERFEVDVIDHDGQSLVMQETRWPRTSAAVARQAIESRAPRRSPLLDEDDTFTLPDGHTAEVLAIPIVSDSGLDAAVVLVTSDAFVVRQTALVTRVLVLGGLLGAIASAASGWFIAGIAVEPIRRLSSVAGQLRPETIDRELVVESSNSEITELTAQLDAARARIRTAFAMQERFLSNISHEIKTPIATILTEAQTIDRSRLSDQALEFVETTEDEMRKLGKLIESFLTLTRVRDGGGLERLKTYLANELVMDAVEDCASMAEQYAVRLQTSLAEEEEAASACVVGDPNLLRTMLNNLIRNAIRFTPREGRVTVNAYLSNSSFHVAVRDQGPGLAPEVLSKIFDRFVQSAEEIRRERGHGLGLAIAKGIAELHHGDIVARNLPDTGAEFEVQLPLADPHPQDDESPPELPANSDAAADPA